jgi:hypothetical protein
MSSECQHLLFNAFLLLVVFQIKHFLADFPLQFPYMLRKFRPGWDFVMPLTSHCLVHGALTLAIVLCVDYRLWWLAAFDFVTHFIMDRIKSGPRYLGRFKDSTSTSYWIAFGFDQMIHHLTHMLIVWIILMNAQ